MVHLNLLLTDEKNVTTIGATAGGGVVAPPANPGDAPKPGASPKPSAPPKPVALAKAVTPAKPVAKPTAKMTGRK